MWRDGSFRSQLGEDKKNISWSETDHCGETDLGNYLFAAFERIEHGLHRCHAARIEREPAGRHGGVGGQAACRPSGCAGGGGAHLRAAGSERLVLGAAAASLERQEEPVLHGGGASESAGLTLGSPTALWSPTLQRTGAAMSRDCGDDLWAQTFDWLAPECLLGHLNADTKGDFLELTLAAAALRSPAASR